MNILKEYLLKDKIYKKLLSGTLAFSLITSPVIASEDSSGSKLPIFIDDTEITEGVLPQLKDGRLFGPVRNISEELGAYVEYNEETKEVTLYKEDIKITMTINSNIALISSDELDIPIEKEFDSPMYVENGRTFIPLRFLAENFGYNVVWDESDGTVTLTEPKESEDKDDEKYNKIDFDVDKKDDRIEMVFDDLDESAAYELNFNEKESDFEIIIDSAKLKEQTLTFNDPLLKEIKTSQVERNEKDENKDVKNYASTIKVSLNYPVPEIKTKESDKKLAFTIPKEFEATIEEKEITEGLKFSSIRKSVQDGPIKIYELKLDSNSALETDLVLAQNRFAGLERLDNIAKRNKAIAAINGGFFWHAGHPIGLYAHNQRLYREPSDNRSAFFYSTDGEPSIERTTFNGGELFIKDKDISIEIDGINRNRERKDVIIYTSEHGNTTGTSTSHIRNHKEFVIDSNGTITHIKNGNSNIPSEGFVLSIHEEYINGNQDKINLLSTGVNTDLTWDLGDKNLDEIKFGLGGSPRIIENNKVEISSVLEGVSDNISKGRSPRTAIGITSDNDIIFTVVDGRQPGTSIGMTLEELGEFMKDRGAHDALNLDGGGSSMMWFDDKYQNSYSPNTPRSISNALIITDK
ncbi:phosphodiester glycosidase family protein [Natranaerobius trueperi]|nr:phosphodiester glycosidase family protein [Natranaerobius trueperi]